MKDREEDIILKTLLAEHGIEEVSPTFTNNLIAKIKAVNTASVLINKWKRIYTIAFILISLLVVGLSFLIKPTKLPIDIAVRLSQIYSVDFLNIILYILAFWVLIALSVWMDKRKISTYGWPTK